MTRRLDWEGSVNARDLGGMRTRHGRMIRSGALVRSGSLAGLTEAGWAALWDHGVRTVIDLRNSDELTPDAAPRPAGIETLHVPLDGLEHADFWELWQGGPQFGTPLYYGPHIERFPERSAQVMAAIADAAPGGVLFHCVRGRDRTGQVAMLALALAGVEATQIAAEYEHGGVDPEAARYLAAQGTTAAEVIVRTLDELDVEAELRDGGLTAEQVAELRGRLYDPADADP